MPPRKTKPKIAVWMASVFRYAVVTANERSFMTTSISPVATIPAGLTLEAANAQQLEGILAKRTASRYHEGKRTRDWLKLKTRNTDEFVVVGYTKGTGRRERSFGSLVLAEHRDGGERSAVRATRAQPS